MLAIPEVLAASSYLLGEIKLHGDNLRDPVKGYGQQDLHADVPKKFDDDVRRCGDSGVVVELEGLASGLKTAKIGWSDADFGKGERILLSSAEKPVENWIAVGGGDVMRSGVEITSGTAYDWDSVSAEQRNASCWRMRTATCSDSCRHSISDAAPVSVEHGAASEI